MDALDLNLKNYTREDIQKLFKLENGYSSQQIDDRFEAFRSKITEEVAYVPQQKQIIGFFANARDILKQQVSKGGVDVDDIYHDGSHVVNQTTTIRAGGGDHFVMSRDTTSLNEVIDSEKYLNPIESFPTHISRGKINVLKRKSLLKTLSFNTLFRENLEETIATNSEFKLPYILNHVISLNLVSVEFPCTFYVFSDEAKNNLFFLQEDTTNLSGWIRIPEGNYTHETLITTMTFYINNTLGSEDRFHVTYDDLTGKLTIQNSVNTFQLDFNVDSNKIYYHFGWIIGYRKGSYFNQMFYTTESIYNASTTDYFYFYLNDYNIVNCDSVVAVFNNSFLENNILAKVPIAVENFQYVFNNNSDFISKKRSFFGPVNIDKLNVRIYNKFGQIMLLNQMDFSFTIEFEILYDL